MNAFFWSLLTPAFVASVVSIAINNRSDKLKARREYITATFEAARKSVEDAVKAAAAYFPLPFASRTALLEAGIWLAERELRFVLSPLTTEPNAGEIDSIKELTIAFDDLISTLTGGSFQSNSATEDLRQVRLIAAAGAQLRAKLSEVRLATLRSAVDEDTLSRFINYWSEQMGPVNYR